MMIFFPYILTFLLGIMGLKALLQDDNTLCPPLFLGLATLLGIAESIFICFFSFVFFNRFHLAFIVIVHLIEIILFFLIINKYSKTRFVLSIFQIQYFDFFAVLLLSGLIALFYVKIYPYGGWDAWQVWNFKSKFLLLSGAHWKEMFDPMLWRSSPHYPLALPLFNAWTGAFAGNSFLTATRINAVLFNILLANLMFGALRQRCDNKFIFSPSIFLFLIPVYMFVAANQYADILLAIFFLASLISFYEFYLSSKSELLLTTGIFLGVLSFIKPEGMILATCVFSSSHFYFLTKKNIRRFCGLLWISSFIAAIPTILFLLFLSPGNQTFINGLQSAIKPSTFIRLKIILIFLKQNLFNFNWGFVWILLFLGGILNLKHLFRKKFFIFFLPIFLYLAVVFAYYWINTYFEIIWWLSVSLTRVLSVILPAIATWISLAIFSEKRAPTEKLGPH